MRWFSTFTQRSLGDAERVELAPAAELGAEHRELADLAADPAEAQAEERPDLAELIPLDRFRSPLDLVPERRLRRDRRSSRRSRGRCRDHWEDVTAAMHADDARRLYVDVADDLQERAALSLSGADAEQELSLRAQRAEFASRTPAEAEAELEKLVRSGYRTVVAFERGGEAERARYNLARIDAPPLAAEAPAEPGVELHRGAAARGLHRPGAEAGRDPLLAPGPPPPPGRGAGPRPGTGSRPRSSCGSATWSSTRTTASRASRASTRRRSRGSPATTWSSSTAAATASSPPPTSSPRSAATSAPTASEAQLSALGGKRWLNLKARARRAAQEMAGELLNLYAERRVRRGHAFSPDGELQLTFEAAFPYRETADQMEAIDAVKADMESRAPDGPPDLRRRRLRQDRGRAARRPQGGRRRQAGDDAGADHDPRPAALRQLPRALRRHALQRRDGLAPAQAGRGEGGARSATARARWTSCSAPTACSRATSAPRTWAC